MNGKCVFAVDNCIDVYFDDTANKNLCNKCKDGYLRSDDFTACVAYNNDDNVCITASATNNCSACDPSQDYFLKTIALLKKCVVNTVPGC
jgi:hypothetical protein